MPQNVVKHLHTYIVLSLCLLLCFSNIVPLLAQEETPPVEPPTTEPPTIEPPTATFTDLPPPIATQTEIPIPAETFTEFSTQAHTETISITLTPTPTETEAETTPEATVESTETATPTLSSATISTATSIPPEPPLALLFREDFAEPNTSAWTLGTGWSLMSNLEMQALAVVNSNAPTRLIQPSNLYNVVVQVNVQMTSGAALLYLRQSSVSEYTAALGLDGQVILARSGVVVQTAWVNASAPESERILRLSVIEDVVRVMIDDTEVIVYTDPLPLPAGGVAVAAQFPSPSSNETPTPHILIVDEVSIWVPEREFGNYTATPTLETPTPTPVLATLPPPSEGSIATLETNLDEELTQESSEDNYTALLDITDTPTAVTYEWHFEDSNEPYGLAGNARRESGTGFNNTAGIVNTKPGGYSGGGTYSGYIILPRYCPVIAFRMRVRTVNTGSYPHVAISVGGYNGSNLFYGQGSYPSSSAWTEIVVSPSSWAADSHIYIQTNYNAGTGSTGSIYVDEVSYTCPSGWEPTATPVGTPPPTPPPDRPPYAWDFDGNDAGPYSLSGEAQLGVGRTGAGIINTKPSMTGAHSGYLVLPRYCPVAVLRMWIRTENTGGYPHVAIFAGNQGLTNLFYSQGSYPSSSGWAERGANPVSWTSDENIYIYTGFNAGTSSHGTIYIDDVSYTCALGWQPTPTPTPTPTSTPTPSCIPPNCAINGSDAIPNPATWSSEQGVYVEALNTTVYGDGTCNGLGTNEDRLDCADDVYDAYYSGFGGTPTLVNLLAALFDEELGQAVSGGQEPAVEAFANNYLASCSEGCTKAKLVWWLASKQGWYGYAGLPLTNLINDTNQSSYSPTAASRVFSETWTGGTGDGNVPFDWGNWAYGTSGYTSIRGGTQTVEYYRIWQAWFDYHSYSLPSQADQRARCDNGFDSGSNRVPSDFWTDYSFAIVTFNQDQALPSVSTYLACLNYQSSSPRTNWLPASEADPVSSSYPPGTYDHPVWP